MRDLPPPARLRLDGCCTQRPDPARAAAEAVADGSSLRSCVLLEVSPRKHRVSFTEGGWWEQVGGLWGPGRPIPSHACAYRGLQSAACANGDGFPRLRARISRISRFCSRHDSIRLLP